MTQKKMEILDGVTIALTWAHGMRQKTVKQREETKNLILELIRLFDKGERSEAGEQLYKMLKSEKEVQFIGFAPYTSYIMMSSKVKDHLGCTFIHPYSMPTLMYKHKVLPMIIHVNPEISYNESKIYRLNPHLSQLRDTSGIMG